jgi:cellulose synthase operon protein C
MVALQTANFEAAAAAHKKFVRMSRTFLSDCHACELDALAGYWMDVGKTTLGVRKAEDLIRGGMRCARVPDGTYADVLLPMVEIGRAADAMRYHKKGYPLVRRNVGDLWHWGDHMAYLSLTGNDARAVKLLEAHLPDVEASHDPLGRLTFLRSMLVVVEGLAEKKEKARLRLPAESPFARESGEYVLSDLAAEVRARAVELSRRFDRRNGNGYYEALVDEAAELRRKATRVPYSS